MKRFIIYLFICFLMTSGCSSSGVKSDDKSDDKGKESSEVIDGEQKTEDSETSIDTSFEGFVAYMSKQVTLKESDEMFEHIIADLPEKFAYLYNAFDKPQEDDSWQNGLMVDFLYLYQFMDDGTYGKAIGEEGMRLIHSVITEDKATFDATLPKIMQYFEEAKIDVETTILNGKIESGQHKVGTDMPAGDYALFTTSSGYFAITSDANGNDIIQNDNFSYNQFITVYDGEYVELSRCYAVPIEGNEIKIDLDKANMLRVGVDIAAGEYKLTANSDNHGYYCIYPDARQQDIIANDNFENSTYVNVSDGQYLYLSRCTIEK